MITRQDIAKLAKDEGVRVQDMIALSFNNDPFNVGTPAHLAAANWFTSLWAVHGEPGKHLRELHYDISTRADEPYYMPKKDGQLYENTLACFNYLIICAKYARVLDYVDPEEIGDEQTPPILLYSADDHLEPLSIGLVDDEYTGMPQLPELPRLDGLANLHSQDLPYLGIEEMGHVPNGPHVEIWAEKSSVTRHIRPLCERYRVNLLPAKGYMTYGAMISFMRRTEASGRAGRLLYISDYDYSGNNIPVQVSRYIEFWQQKYPDFNGLDIRLHQLAITPEQIDQYNLPLADVPTSKMNRRHEEFLKLSGGIVEVEAINPYLADIVEPTLKRYRDLSIAGRTWAVRHSLEARLEELTDEIKDRHNVDDLIADYETLQSDFEDARRRFAELVEPFQSEIDVYIVRHNELNDRLDDVYSYMYIDLNDAIKSVELADYPLPEPKLPDEPTALYDSRRDYLDQLESYKRHRQNGDV